MPENVSFNSIPVDIRTPGQYIEMDNSRAVSGLPAQQRKILVVGQRLSTGTVVAGVATRIFSAAQAVGFFGRGSMLATMIAAAKAANPTSEMWAMALDDLGGGAKATGTFAFTGPATAAGTLAAYIGGTRVPVGVAVGDTASNVAANLVAAITALPDLNVTAAASTGTVTCTANHKGLAGNDIDLRLNYYQGEVLPAGIGCTVTGMASGSGNPDVTAIFTAIGDDQYYTIIGPWNDSANLTVIETQLDVKWGPMKQKTGHYFCAFKGTVSGCTSAGTARNSLETTIIGVYDSPTPTYVWAATLGAICEFNGAIDPARPFQTLALPGVLAPPIKSRFLREERDVLLRSGISTFTVAQDGTVQIERVVTTYQVNPYSVPDVSWLDLETKWTVDYIRYAVRARIALRFPRHKLANDGFNYGPGQPIVTPSIIRAELIALFREMERAGLVEDFDQYQADLLVVRSDSDQNRVNAIIPPNVVNQFRVFAAAIQYRL